MEDMDNDLIVDAIYSQFQEHHIGTTPSEIRSWKNSLVYMYRALNDDLIPTDSGVAIEFKIPATDRRIDFTITGYDKTKNPSVIIIELKQWEKCSVVKEKDGLVAANDNFKVQTFIGKKDREVEHPAYKAYTYAHLMGDFNDSIEKNDISLHPCAYLHNYKIWDQDPLLDQQYQEYLDEAPVFGLGDVIKLRTFIKKYIKSGDQEKVLYEIDNGKIKPSKSLQDCVAKMLAGNEEFLMIDEQKIIYEHLLRQGKHLKNTEKKKVTIVLGGPGTGKSVLAINLLVKFTNQDLVTQYVTKNSAPRKVFFEKLRGKFKQNYVNNLFKGSGVYVDAQTNEFDVLIADEAHRLNEKSGLYGNLGDNQIKEIIDAAKFSIFFLDEHQQVTLKDIGCVSLIEQFAKELGAEVEVAQLSSQFRCNGSNGYLAWIDDVLDIAHTENPEFSNQYDYDFQVFDNPNELRAAILEKNKKNNKSRLVAGYCWEWNSAGKNDTDIHDINIPEYDFHMSWNLDGGAPFAIAQTSVNEIGCIHTCQGLEFDYVGVIIGDDLRFENGKLVTDHSKRASTDQSLKGLKKMIQDNPKEAEEIADKIIKNTYRTLMTRGMKGCYIYCIDKNLSEYFKRRILKKD